MAKTILNFDHLDHLPLPSYENLKQHFHVVELFREKDPDNSIWQHRDDTVAIICNTPHKISAKLIAALPNLEIIATNSVGLDHIDLDTAQRRSVVVTHTPDLVTNDTADLALSLMLNIARRFVEADAYVRIGKWRTNGSFGLGHTLSHKSVGIVGLGRIGQAIASRAEAFNCVIRYTARAEKKVPYEFATNVKELAEKSDFLVLCCAATQETQGLVDLDVLNSLGPKGYLINVARGVVVNEEDLLIALSNRTIAGAGLDVYQNEPNVPEALKTMDNVVLYPHLGSATHETRADMANLVIENIRQWFEHGETLTRAV